MTPRGVVATRRRMAIQRRACSGVNSVCGSRGHIACVLGAARAWVPLRCRVPSPKLCLGFRSVTVEGPHRQGRRGALAEAFERRGQSHEQLEPRAMHAPCRGCSLEKHLSRPKLNSHCRGAFCVPRALRSGIPPGRLAARRKHAELPADGSWGDLFAAPSRPCESGRDPWEA